jgi:uncharacterized delta-60 repeat protein
LKTNPIFLYFALQWFLAISASAATPKYDVDGRLIRVTYADGSTIETPRDSNGNQIDRIDGRPLELILTVDPPGSGTVTGAGRYLRSTQQSLTATAGGDFVFDSWKRADGTVLSTSPYYSHTLTAAETLTAHFRALSPEIVIEDTTSDPAANLADGTSTLVFSDPSPLTRTLTVRNIGTAPLTGLSATLDGPGVSLFSKTGLPTSLAAGGSVSFTIQFSPITPVVSTAALHVLSNDADEGSFDLALNGTMPCPAVNVLPPAASQGIVGTAINRVFTQAGGLGAVIFALATGSLPSGVTLSSNGTLAGTPSQTGSFPMTVSVTDSYGCTGISSTYTLLISSGDPDGSLDSSFGSDGKTTTHFGSGGDIAFGVVLQPDGKAVAAGYAFHEGKKRFALARYNVDGSLDATFNSTGKVITSVSSGEDEAHCLALQPDGKIIAAGFTRPATAEVALVRYHTNGTLDTSFGSAGKVITAVAEGDDDARAILIQPDGKIVIVGYGYRSSGTNDVIILRYNADGTLDNGFGTGGKLMFAFGGSYDNGFGAALQPDGKIIAVGSTFDGLDHWAIARITSNGTLDSSFDSDGKITTSFATGSQSASGVAIQADGKIVVGGEADIGGGYNFALARYNSNGSLDTTFGSGGKVTTDWHGRMDLGRSLAIQRDGKILLGGMARNPADKFNMAVARYLRDGSLDTSFGTVGKTLISVGSTDDRANALAVMPFGAVTLAGQSFNGSDDDFAVVRVNANVTAPDLDIQNSTGHLLATNETVELGAVIIGASKSVSLSIKNSGNADLTAIAPVIEGVDSAMFSISTSPPSSVLPNGTGIFVIHFAPTSQGQRTATLVLTSNDPDESPFILTLGGTGIAPTSITSHPVGGVLSRGGSHNLNVGALGSGTLTYRWKFNGEELAQTGASLTLQNASFLDAGTYIVEVTGEGGSVQSLPALITVPLDSYNTWQSKVFSPAELTANNPAVIGPDARSGSAGIMNLLLYAMGNRSRDQMPADAFGMSAGSVFQYNRLIGSGGLSYQVEFSRDLLTWESSGGNLEPYGSAAPNPDGVTERVGVRLNQTLRNELSKAFFRLKIQQASEVFLNASAFNYFDDADPGLGYPNVVWSQVPIPGRFEDTANGLLFKASRPRGGGTVLTKSLHVLAGRTVEFLWDGNGGSSFMQPVCGFTPNQWHSEWNLDNSFIVCDFGNVWNSWLASPGVIYKTSVIFTPTSATLITINSVTGQEHDRKTRSGDFTLPLRPFFRGGDTHDYNGAFIRLRSLTIRTD